MDLILWRHAEAADGFPDHGRALTAKGERQAEKMAQFIRPHLPSDVRILVSPALRTRQTVVKLTDHYTLAPTIAPGASVQDVLQATRWPDAGDTVLVVGHQPTLGAVVAHLMGCQEEKFSIKKGSLWWFTRRERNGVVQNTLRLAITTEFLVSD
ncbi:MAG: histidine phosphatase family protein [Gallionella sp.]|nr:histidine phosphatase family protein [Gallionella sp.]MDD4959810.1 histidine phosphatase family protein [Gallionella sp.]